MKSLQDPNLKTRALTKAMETVIPSYHEQAFDNMSEGNEKVNFECFIVQKPLRPLPRSEERMKSVCDEKCV